MSEKSVLILGATSDIGIALAKKFLKDNFSVQLASRNLHSLKNLQKTLLAQNLSSKVTIHRFDVLESRNYENFVKRLPTLPEIAICLIGSMGSQKQSEKNLAQSISLIRTNFEGPASILNLLANDFENRGSGLLVGISSVAGERGRGSNYIYGSSKAGFTAFLSGLRSRLASKNVHVLTVIPGYMNTKMTRELRLPSVLTSSSQVVAKKIYDAIKKRKNVIYVNGLWFYIMLFIKIIPEKFFKKLHI